MQRRLSLLDTTLTQNRLEEDDFLVDDYDFVHTIQIRASRYRPTSTNVLAQDVSIEEGITFDLIKHL